MKLVNNWWNWWSLPDKLNRDLFCKNVWKLGNFLEPQKFVKKNKLKVNRKFLPVTSSLSLKSFFFMTHFSYLIRFYIEVIFNSVVRINYVKVENKMRSADFSLPHKYFSFFLLICICWNSLVKRDFSEHLNKRRQSSSSLDKLELHLIFF